MRTFRIKVNRQVLSGKTHLEWQIYEIIGPGNYRGPRVFKQVKINVPSWSVLDSEQEALYIETKGTLNENGDIGSID